MNKPLTIGDIRAATKDFPDDAIIVVDVDRKKMGDERYVVSAECSINFIGGAIVTLELESDNGLSN